VIASLRRLVVVYGLLAGVLLCSCASTSPDYSGARTFSSPEQAVSALVAAATSGDADALRELFGPGSERVLASGDPVADRHNLEVFAVAISEGWSLRRIDGSSRELTVGPEDWPFPIPLAKDRHGWWFDIAAGEEEVLARRIGRNELAAIGTLQSYATAQRDYASVGHDGRPAGVYAQRVRSEPGRRNGLYWPASGPQEAPSPLGEFAAQAEAQGYRDGSEGGARPYNGYFFRILTRQGPDAPGGRADYVVNGDMTGGFAMIAFPAEYMNSGVMTFLVGPDGIVYESDLGPGTGVDASAVTEFNPGPGWSLVR
jgi:hypothetical protein